MLYRGGVGTPAVPAFIVEQRPGWSDYLAVHLRLLPSAHDTVIEVALRASAEPEALTARLATLAGRAALLMRDAITGGDWAPYIEQVRELGACYAELDLGLERWYAAIRMFQRRVMPALVEAYAASPTRLSDALAAGTDLIDFLMEVVSERYFEIRDRSQRRQIEVALESRTRELERANHELEAFSYTAAHDLRAPLRAMAGFSDALLEDYGAALEPGAVRYIDKIQASARRMAALIDGLLDLSQLARRQLQRQLVDLTTIARQVIAQLATSDPRRTVDTVVEDRLVAEIDPRLARTLFENLIGNAWKFTGKTAAPRIVVGAIDGRTLFVRDNGAGFDVAHAGKLFTPFERMHSDAEFSGTGIGLATVQRIIERHGGRIWAEAQPGQGATFLFTLG
jgi:signal transduction histidine kinase